MSRALLVMGVLLLAACTVQDEEGRPLVGAIRWDAWTGGEITAEVERTLGPKKYHNRLPWFAEVINDSTVKIDGGRQKVMDREIGFAAAAGLDYWAFLAYEEDSPMSTGLEQYLKSPNREQIRFCLILHHILTVPDDSWPMERDRAIALLQQSGYQTVLNGRPLVYGYLGSNFPWDRFDEFLAAARKIGLNPYSVYMGWNPANDFLAVKDKGFDAVSAYARSGSQSTFSDLVTAVEQGYWNNAVKSEVRYVPLVTTGWDKRPRKDNPVSWEQGHPYQRQEVFPSKATPAELSEHLRNALAIVRKHPGLSPADTVIVYSWNEYDEGGWIAPTRGPDGKPDTSRLDAIRAVLKNTEPSQAVPAVDILEAVPVQ